MRARPTDQAGGNLPPRAGNAGATIESPTGETATVLSSGPRPKIFDDEVTARDGMVRGSAVDEDDKPGEPPPTVFRYVVERDAKFTHNGHRVVVTTGKIVDSLNYDIKHLLRQGVRLKKLEEGQDAYDVLGQN